MTHRRILIGLALVVALLPVVASGHLIGLVYYPPAIADDGTLYVSGSDGFVYGLAHDGEARWIRNASAELSTPVVVIDGVAAAGTLDGRVVGYAQSDGTTRWTLDVPSGPGRERINGLRAAHGTVYAVTDRTVVAIDANTGTRQWVITGLGELRSAVAVGNGTIYVASQDGDQGRLTAIDRDGERRWSKAYPQELSAPTVGPDGTVYIERNGTVWALSANGTTRWGVEVGSVWTQPDVHGNAVVVGTFEGRVAVLANGSIIWSRMVEGPAAPAFGPTGEAVYAVTPAGVVGLADGKRRWQTSIRGLVLRPPSVGPSRIYASSQTNRTYALAPNGSIVWINQYTTPFGSYFGLPENAELPQVPTLTRPATRIVGEGLLADASATVDRPFRSQRPLVGGALVVAVGALLLLLVAVRRRR